MARKIFIECLAPSVDLQIDGFPFVVGRDPTGVHGLKVDDSSVSRNQFRLEVRDRVHLVLVNLSEENPVEYDGEQVSGEVEVDLGYIHSVRIGYTLLAIGTDSDVAKELVQENAEEYYCGTTGAVTFGPYNYNQLVCHNQSGFITGDAVVWKQSDPSSRQSLSSLLGLLSVGFSMTEGRFDDPAPVVREKRFKTVDEGGAPVIGDSFACPYCRALVDLGDLLWVSVSQELLGIDPVLGPDTQKRFTMSRRTANNLAIDECGGVCKELACPHCHMALPRQFVMCPQIVMSVIGAPGAGKSVFLASSLWQCKQKLRENFGVTFMDLDPVANKTINSNMEKLFFQEDVNSMKQIEKTEKNAPTVCKSVNLDGGEKLLPLPCFFRVRHGREDEFKNFVVYDSAGEHFEAGADTNASAVTLNMLNADVLFFMFDPSADPRFSKLLDRGDGNASNRAQRQDIVLMEMAARIERHLGNRAGDHLDRPLIFGVSKADLLHEHLPLDMPIYREIAPGQKALDYDALRELSNRTEKLFADVHAHEILDIAHEIASEVWFLPVSSLGHNPSKDGVRPCDIKPIFTELPVVFTLARKGVIPTVGNPF